MRKVFVSVLCGGFLLSACSGSGGLDAADQEYVDALSKYFIEDFEREVGGGSEEVVADKDFECLSKKIVEEVGAERFKDLGVEPGDVGSVLQSSPIDQPDLDLSDKEKDTLSNAPVDCFGVKKMAIFGLIGGGVERADAECLMGEMDIDLMEDAEVAARNDEYEELQELDQEIVKQFEKAAGICGVEDLRS